VRSVSEILRGLPYFSDLEDELLDRVCVASDQIEIAPQQTIIEEKSHSEEMYVIVEGQLEVWKTGPTRNIVLATLGPGDVVGEMALLDKAPRTASVTSLTDSTLIRIPASAFEDLITDSRVVRRMFHTVISRLRGIEETLRHEERMAALGRMAAQLMHELNNPAAAVARSAAGLAAIYESLGEAAVMLSKTGVEISARASPPDRPLELDPLTRSDLEDAMAEKLETLGVLNPWELAPTLVQDGWDSGALDNLVEGLDQESGAALASWVGLRSLASQVIGELQIGIGRISELVRIVKDYSYLDQAPVQEIDPTAGIADTLVLLKHKLGGIEVVTDFARDLAHIEAPGRDINQVWTNLIDNAIGAMDGKGTLTIRTQSEDGHLMVEIADDGPGIPEDVQSHIFDPFYTTKDSGTGLGLALTQKTAELHGGRIEADTRPGEGTEFILFFPKQSDLGDQLS